MKNWSSDGKFQKLESAQKENYIQLLQSNMSARATQLVAEEWRHGEESIAERICNRMEIRYANVEMTPEERRERQIPPGYNEDANYPATEKQRCNGEREEYMLAKMMAALGKEENVLLICGREHMDPIADQLRQRGHTVETIDLTKELWYVENWTETWDKL
jgi:hypothetical protein